MKPLNNSNIKEMVDFHYLFVEEISNRLEITPLIYYELPSEKKYAEVIMESSLGVGMTIDVVNSILQIETWNTSNVTDMRNLFRGKRYFNGDISKWNTSKVTELKDILNGCIYFNRNLSEWKINIKPKYQPPNTSLYPQANYDDGQYIDRMPEVSTYQQLACSVFHGTRFPNTNKPLLYLERLFNTTFEETYNIYQEERNSVVALNAIESIQRTIRLVGEKRKSRKSHKMSPLPPPSWAEKILHVPRFAKHISENFGKPEIHNLFRAFFYNKTPCLTIDTNLPVSSDKEQPYEITRTISLPKCNKINNTCVIAGGTRRKRG